MIEIIVVLGILLFLSMFAITFLIIENKDKDATLETHNHRINNIHDRMAEQERFLLGEIKENRGDLNILADHLGVRFDTVPPQKSKRILRDKEDDSLVSEGVNNLEGI